MDASAKYYFNDQFGLGAVYSLYSASSDALSPASVTSKITFVGPSFLVRGQFPGHEKWLFDCSLGIGYIGYNLSAKYLGSYAEITGGSAGFLVDLGVEHRFHKNLGIAFNLTSVSGFLTEVSINENGQKETVEFSDNEYEGLQNIRFSVGFRYYIK